MSTSISQKLFNKSVLYNHYQQKFRQIFGVSLSQFWDKLFGFDIIKFDDEFIKAPDGKSAKDVVLEKYGQEAVDLIMRLL